MAANLAESLLVTWYILSICIGSVFVESATKSSPQFRVSSRDTGHAYIARLILNWVTFIVIAGHRV